ncbi:hypothetical protein SGRI78S_06746 [Streptomyces griseus subsp. griseus]
MTTVISGPPDSTITVRSTSAVPVSGSIRSARTPGSTTSGGSCITRCAWHSGAWLGSRAAPTASTIRSNGTAAPPSPAATAPRALATSSRKVGSPPIRTRSGTGFTNMPTASADSGPGRPDTRVAATTSS